MYYFLVHYKKWQEYKKFMDFWEKELYPKTEALLADYFKENKGEVITESFYRQLLAESPMVDLKYYQMDDFGIIFCIGKTTADGFEWDGLRIGNAVVNRIINDNKSLEEFLKYHEEYVLFDENNREVSFEEFKNSTQESHSFKQREG